jgi:hypothetical protein
MIRYSRLDHRFVHDMPETLEPGILYVSMHYATVMHLCCCGCGREVVTPLSPAQWRLTFDGESVSLAPSVGSWEIPCRSHYVISHGRVVEAPSWSEEDVSHGQARDKRARAAHYQPKTTHKAAEGQAPLQPGKRGWLSKLGNFWNGKPKDN